MAWERTCVILHILLVIWSGVTSSSNMASQTDPANDGRYFIEVCFDLSVYSPTCGWNVLISCSYPLKSVLSFNYNEAVRDDYSFILSNNDRNAQLPQNTCQRMTLEGNWGSTNPVVAASWLCVCDASSSGQCKATPNPIEVPAHDAQQEVTEDFIDNRMISVDDIEVPMVVSTSAVTLYKGHELENPTRIQMSRTTPQCYTGPTFSMTTEVRSPIECARLCLSSQDCGGVNFRASGTRCDLVNATQDVASALATQADVSACQYWAVVEKLV